MVLCRLIIHQYYYTHIKEISQLMGNLFCVPFTDRGSIKRQEIC